jgi:hypothetical protein
LVIGAAGDAWRKGSDSTQGPAQAFLLDTASTRNKSLFASFSSEKEDVFFLDNEPSIH